MSKFRGLIRVPGVLTIALLGGCGPQVPDEELGRVVFEMPEIPPGYEPYELPDLTTSSDDTSSEVPDKPSDDPKPDTAQPTDQSAAAR